MFSLHGLPPVPVAMAAALILVAAVGGVGLVLVRASATLYQLRRQRMPRTLMRLYRAMQPVRRHYHLHEHRLSPDWRTFHAKE